MLWKMMAGKVMVLSAVIWKHSHEDFGFTAWNQHCKSETALKWHKDTIASSTYILLIRIFLEADKVVETQRLLQFIITFVQGLVTPDRSVEPSKLKLLDGTDLFETISKRCYLCNIAFTHPTSGVGSQACSPSGD